MANRESISLTEGSTEYQFQLGQKEDGGEFLTIQTKGWEQGDYVFPWRYPVHKDLHAGLRSDRLTEPKGYAKGNCDVSNPGLIVPPPLLGTITAPSGTALEIVRYRASANNTAGAGTSITITKPTGTIDNDVMFAWIVINTIDAITAPAGWTLIRSTTFDTNQRRASLYWKLAASEGANYQWTTVGAQNWAGGITTLYNVNTTSPFDVENAIATAASPHATPSVTPAVAANAAILTFFGLYDSAGGANTWTPPTGMTEAWDNNIASGGVATSSEGAYLQSWIAASAVTKSAESSVSTVGVAQILVVKAKATTINISTTYDRCVLFNSKAYFASTTGRYLVQITDTPTATVAKDFGSGTVISFIKVFNNELIIGLGASNFIWSMTTTGVFTESLDVKGIAAGVVDNKFWIAHDTNQIQNCITGPLTLANYVPADPNEYLVGDTTWAITEILDYGSVPFAFKPNGVFAPDVKAEFHNQAPQMALMPSGYNIWPFIAQGAIFQPTVSGLLRITPGESLFVGPEKSERPDYRFRLYHGCEWGEAIYVVGHTITGSDYSAVFKMVRDKYGITNNPYLYYEHLRLGDTNVPVCIMVLPSETMPLMIIGKGNVLQYFELGRGGGRYIDDPNYSFNLSWELESGDFIPYGNMATKSVFVGVKVLLDHDSSESLTLSYDANHTGSYTSLLDTQEGGGSAAITATGGYASITRYAAANVTCQQLAIKLTGTLSDAHSGTDRPEVREIWAFGYHIPDSTHLIQIGIRAESSAQVFGMHQGMSEGDIFRIFSDWANEGTILTLALKDYEENRTVRVRVLDPLLTQVSVKDEGSPTRSRISLVTATLERVDYAGAFTDA